MGTDVGVRIVFALIFTMPLFIPASAAEDQSQDEINPALLRRFWVGDTEPQPAAPYVLTSQERSRFGGTFGIDLSHYSFDIDNSDPKCRTQEGYQDRACSCTIDWQGISDNKLLYVYSKASDGNGVDLSFARLWSQLESKHSSKTIFRGGFHFLRPGVDANAQADSFLQAVGAVDGRKPEQLPPVLDIEWSNKQVIPGTAEFNACPQSRRTRNDQGRYYCDMWYKVQPSVIAEIAKRWIDRVEAATGRPVIVYTNPTAWWNAVMTPSEDFLLRMRAVWTSRYTSRGPQYNPSWTAEGGSPKWKMAPLPRGASYPQESYNVPHTWQFTEAGNLPSSVFTCSGSLQRRNLDMNWVPVSSAEVPKLFGIDAHQ